MRKPGTTGAGTSLLDMFFTQRYRLIGLALRITGCRSQAEDVVHEAFMKMDDAGQDSQIRSQASYLSRIVRNLSIDHYRRRQLEERLLEQIHATTCATPSSTRSPEEQIADRQLLERICEALADLPERTRQVFEMSRIHGMKQREIADALGISPALVSALVNEAVLHCREVL
ncbi:sigma-70 family RNA polymerase sigma factor [Pseudomonas sp. 3A(2025)]